ncbi:N-acetylglucosamine-induced 1 [Hyphodiscus hymeniophilus]|uniref:N-acetylglucosamine-induced 1 n=1 Tax=Hyphodiscus hymeniophilus TaxID=353542 RepID=A0A9P7AZ61_9HELO|nr:N-acetylglucosamine-induced 1 [Hyphodiscus hymeniophilus]
MGSLNPTDSPYWQINVPVSLRTADCPAFLLDLSAKDKGIISTPDSQYHVLTWPEVQLIISRNRIDLFQRVPSELRRYLAYNWELRQKYGSVMEFVLQERLGWEVPIAAEGKPFEEKTDIKVLWNDWPYGIDERIVHLVVWTKFELEDDPKTDDLTEEARAKINEYVDEVFGKRAGKENVIWFKNWKSLKSVHAVEHFHVMLFDPDPDFVREITNGDVPLSRKV